MKQSIFKVGEKDIKKVAMLLLNEAEEPFSEYRGDLFEVVKKVKPNRRSG